MTVRPAKTQISLGIRPVWSESSLCAQWVAKDPSFRHADSEDSDQTGRMPTLIWVFAGRTCHFVGFVTRRPIFLYAMDIIAWNSVALKVICVHAIIFVNIMFPLKIDRINFFHFTNNLKKTSFGNTASNVWIQPTRFDRVCSWEVLADATSPKPPSPGLSATLLPNKSIKAYSHRRKTARSNPNSVACITVKNSNFNFWEISYLALPFFVKKNIFCYICYPDFFREV